MKTEYGRRFTLAPRSSNALSIHFLPIVTAMVGHLGSLYFTSVLFSIMALTCLVKKDFFFLLMFRFCLTVHKSLRNLA